MAVLAAVAAVALAGCQSGGRTGARPVTPPIATPVTSTPSPGASAIPSRTAARTPAPSRTRVAHALAVSRPPFTSAVARVTAAELGKSWHSGCPVGPSSLRAVTMTFWGFDAKAHTGTLVVAVRSVGPVVEAFRQMYDGRFPIRRMVPIAAYGGDDDKSMAADNTSAFNCRYAVSDGPKSWSMHAYGQAVDINTLENPYTLGGRVYPPAGKPYTDRSKRRPGMIVPGSVPVRAFSSVGWGWGGRWSSSPDYQHFSANGK